MVNPSTLLSGLTFAMSLSERQANEELRQQLAASGDVAEEELPASMQYDKEIAQRQEETSRKLERLIAIEEKHQPSPGDKDAFTSATIELEAGETAQVTVEPAEGFNLRVKSVYFDRRDDHSYEINVGGDISSVSHRAKYTSPKLVSQSDRVVASVTNNSSGATIVDFEIEAWAERP